MDRGRLAPKNGVEMIYRLTSHSNVPLSTEVEWIPDDFKAHRLLRQPVGLRAFCQGERGVVRSLVLELQAVPGRIQFPTSINGVNPS